MSKSKLIHLEDMDLETVIKRIEERAELDGIDLQFRAYYNYGALQSAYNQLYHYVTSGILRAAPPLNPSKNN